MTASRGILVHEWLENGGAENVFEHLGRIFPQAERWCMWNDASSRFLGVHETVLARTPLRRHKAAALLAMPTVWRHLPARTAPWVLCSSHLFAHHARFSGPARQAPKLVYAHTPARYIWTPDVDERGSGAFARAASATLKPLDRRRAREAHTIAANSAYVAAKIHAVWGREAEVIYPPVNVARFGVDEPSLTAAEARTVQGLPSEYLLGMSRFVSYKRLDAVIQAGAAVNLPVVIAGSGPDEARLRHAAAASGVHVSFVMAPSDGVVNALYRRAAAVVFAPIEDFGVVPVEAMAAGTPVIANAVGGAAESVLDGVTGALVHTWEPDELRVAVDRALAVDPDACRERAECFDAEIFADRIRAWVARSVGEA